MSKLWKFFSDSIKTLDAEINKILLDRAGYDAESSRYAGYTDVIKVTHLLIAIVKECVLSISFHFFAEKRSRACDLV